MLSLFFISWRVCVVYHSAVMKIVILRAELVIIICNFVLPDHCMVQFVKPNLLGTRKEFQNRFVNPISNGQFEDSTAHDVKIMKRRAHVLHKMLEGSVQVDLFISYKCNMHCRYFTCVSKFCIIFIMPMEKSFVYLKLLCLGIGMTKMRDYAVSVWTSKFKRSHREKQWE